MKLSREKNFGYLISVCNSQLIKLLNREFLNRELNLTREQYIVLDILWEKDMVSQQTLANQLGKDKYSITKLIDGLEKRGLVQRTASESDRRTKLIKVTPRAHEIRHLVKETVEITIDKALSNISERDINTTRAVLEKIIQNVNA